MDCRTFEVQYCLKCEQNICVEVTRQGESGVPVKRCLYEDDQCRACPYQLSCPENRA